MQQQSKLLSKDYVGVYELSCAYGGEYFGETKELVLIRSVDHQDDSMTEK